MDKRIIGLKVTHDSAVAMIEGNRLVFCTEFEKLENGHRYTKLHDLELLWKVLSQEGAFHRDALVVDGWRGGVAASPAITLDSAHYHEFDRDEPGDAAERSVHSHKLLGNYSSYNHMLGHIIGAYVTSPFSKAGWPAAVISWDGGQNPRIHIVDPSKTDNPVLFLAQVHDLYGVIYAIMGLYFGPYKRDEIIKSKVDHDGEAIFQFLSYDTPGKLMSYIALGKPRDKLVARLLELYLAIEGKRRNELTLLERLAENCRRDLPKSEKRLRDTCAVELTLMRQFHEYATTHTDADGKAYSDADCLASVHQFLEDLLVRRVTRLVPKGARLCFAGGSALNIKWNSALRDTGHFTDVWVPPFPNDCGSAIGAAACEAALVHGVWHLEWDVYSGPMIIDNISWRDVNHDWFVRMSSPSEIAKILAHEMDEAIVVLEGRAEIGPRALGHRSLLMSAKLASNKEKLNAYKKREPFRPVAPICLEEFAPRWFTPGTPDPYMLFDHEVYFDMREIIPAVVHLDGTARLQTVSEQSDPFMHEVLTLYYDLTGIPLLCNTSANMNGHGFFPDAMSALEWAKVNGVKYVFCNNTIYTRKGDGQ